MDKTKTVNISKSKGPLTLEIKGEAASAGKFSFGIETDTGYSIVFKGMFGDSIPDIFLLPVKVDELSGRDLYMIGNFAPGSPDSNKIAFSMNFYQGGTVIDTELLQESNSGVLPIQYTINFNVGD